jgi:hypothetical protein
VLDDIDISSACRQHGDGHQYGSSEAAGDTTAPLAAETDAGDSDGCFRIRGDMGERRESGVVMST